MNLSCAILHTNAQTARILEEYAGKTPFLTLCGTYTHTTDALKDYYERKVDVYFIGLEKSTEDDLSGLEFARLLSQPTRCIFIAHDGSYASECFRLDALDYLEGDIKFPIFFQATHKALRWFSLQKTGLPQNTPKANEHKEKNGSSDIIYIKAESRLIRLKLDHIYYIEAWGDYVKIFCSDEEKPILSLCSLKYMEEKLPSALFIRIHRSYIVRKACIRTIMQNSMHVVGRELPIGEAYRKRVKELVSHLLIL